MSHDGDGDSDSPANDGDGEALQEGSPTPTQALKGDSPLLDREKSGIDPTSSPAKTIRSRRLSPMLFLFRWKRLSL